jgi:hypothetical protein
MNQTIHLLAVPYPGDAGWGDVLFVILWALGSLLLAAFYVYKAYFTPR